MDPHILTKPQHLKYFPPLMGVIFYPKTFSKLIFFYQAKGLNLILLKSFIFNHTINQR